MSSVTRGLRPVRVRHVIADIRYTPAGPCWLECSCGARGDAPTPELLSWWLGSWHKAAPGA